MLFTVSFCLPLPVFSSVLRHASICVMINMRQAAAKGMLMKMIVGLGNPGRKYEKTRHNMGWEALDRAADNAGIKVNVNRYHGLTGMGVIAGEKVILVKPLTYMNLSGDCVQPLAAYYKIPPEDILVICDDVNLPLGRIRFRKSGSAGGHNGLKSIIGRLGSDAFPRLRLGVGGPGEGIDLIDHVLMPFLGEDAAKAEALAKTAAEAVLCFLTDGPDKVMNEYNSRKE